MASDAAASNAAPARLWLVHFLLFITMGVGVGIGTVIGNIGLEGADPVVFAFLRDLFASMILGTWAYFKDQRRITMSEFKQIAWAGIAMYLSNICYTIGVKMSNPVIGAAWQCACPICTAAMAIALKTEKATSRKMWGIGWAFAGSVFIVFFGQEVSLSSTEFVGNIFFFFNVLGYSAYCIMSKPLVKAGLPPITITAWAMLVVTAMLGVTVYIGENSPFLHSMLCDGCEDIWSLETDEILALAYFVLVFSVFLYVCIAWANQHVSSSIVSSYTVFQPGMAAFFCYILVQNGWNDTHPNGQLEEPGWNALGMVGVLLGLGLLIYDDLESAKATPVAAAGPDGGPLAGAGGSKPRGKKQKKPKKKQYASLGIDDQGVASL